MKRERLHSLIAMVSIMVTAILLGLLVSGCAKDCPTCPKVEESRRYRGWLYYTEGVSDNTTLYKVDMETDSIVDSLKQEDPREALGRLGVSSDGRFLGLMYSKTSDSSLTQMDRTTRIYDAQTQAHITDLSEGVTPFFDTYDNLLIGLRADTTGNYIIVMQIPTFTSMRVDSVGNFLPRLIDPSHDLLYGNASNTGWTHEYATGFYSYNYASHELKPLPILWSPTDTIEYVYTLCLSSNGEILYFTGAEHAGATVFGAMAGAFDLNSRTLLWYYPLVTPIGGIAVSPDGKEVWVTDPGPTGYDWDSGTIFILDASTGRYLQGISMYGYLPDSNPYFSLPGRGIVFSPAGDRAYVQASHTFTNPYGTVVVVDAKKKAIVKLLRPNMHS
ncbi:MAG: hypothetical protein NT028_07525, partial [candidate division Zixibacteria bacterium]|nr:hypothetical protein [candidate division Zixibacteria bacterium]